MDDPESLPPRALEFTDSFPEPLPIHGIGAHVLPDERPARALVDQDRPSRALPLQDLPARSRALSPAPEADAIPARGRWITDEVGGTPAHAFVQPAPARAIVASVADQPFDAPAHAFVQPLAHGSSESLPARAFAQPVAEPPSDGSPARAFVESEDAPTGAQATPTPAGPLRGIPASEESPFGLDDAPTTVTLLHALPAPPPSPFGLDDDAPTSVNLLHALPAPPQSPFGLDHEEEAPARAAFVAAPERVQSAPAAAAPVTAPLAPVPPVPPVAASLAVPSGPPQVPTPPVPPIAESPYRAARIAPPTATGSVWAPRRDRRPPARSAQTPASTPRSASAPRPEQPQPAPGRERPAQQTATASGPSTQPRPDQDAPTQLLRPVLVAEPRRGKPRRPRHHVPIAAGVLAVGAAALALFVTSLPTGPAAVPVQPTPMVSAANARVTASPTSTAVSTVYAAGAFAAPQTGGVRLTPSTDGPLKGKVIVVDPGHNGGWLSSINNKSHYTYGAGWRPCAQAGTTTYTGVAEHTITWQLANKVVPLLLAKGATVVLTRADDTGYGPCNSERPEIANREGADLFLSLHVDGNETTSLRGFHVTWSPKMAGGQAVSAASEQASSILMRHILDGTDLPGSNYVQSGGVPIVTRTDLAVLDGIRGAPALLLETGNSRNPDDVAFLTSDAGQFSLAKALTAAALEIVGTVPANTGAGASSPSPSAPPGASTPPVNAPTPTWEATATVTSDEAGPEMTPTWAATAAASGNPDS